MDQQTAQPTQPAQAPTQAPQPATAAPQPQPQPQAPVQQPQPGSQNKGGGKGILFAVLFILILAGIGLFVLKGKKSNTPAPQQSTTQQAAAPTTPPVPTEASLDNTTIKAGATTDQDLSQGDNSIQTSMSNIDKSFDDVNSGFTDTPDNMQ